MCESVNSTPGVWVRVCESVVLPAVRREWRNARLPGMPGGGEEGGEPVGGGGGGAGGG